MFFVVVTILAFSIFIRQFLRYAVYKSNRLFSLLKQHVSVITFLIATGIVFIPIGIWTISGGVIDFGEITQKFLASLLFSVVAAIILELIEYSPVGEPLKVKEKLSMDATENTRLWAELPRSSEARIELDTLERNFGFTAATKVSFDAINRFDTAAEYMLLEQEIDRL
jgi:hypothetical protein